MYQSFDNLTLNWDDQSFFREFHRNLLRVRPSFSLCNSYKLHMNLELI